MVSPSFHSTWHTFGLKLVSTAAVLGAIAIPVSVYPAIAQNARDGRALTLRSDVQEANAITGVITARGNVQMNYPARRIQATSAQAQYYSQERRIVLLGNVYILQEGNSIRGERVTYLVDEGRFLALPSEGQQVESIYIIPDPSAPAVAPAATTGE